MKPCFHDDTTQHTGSNGDVDDLIFCTDFDWSASQR